jgi:hypothetical protein
MQMIPMEGGKEATASIQPIAFFLRYLPDPNDPTKLIAREYVTWAKKGVTIPATVVEPIHKIERAAKKATEPDDEYAAKWRAIKPFYDNWKAGGEADAITNGMPLSIWPAVTRDVVEALKPFRIYTVEDLSIAKDDVLNRVPNPNMVRYRERARKYLETKDVAIAVRDLDESKAQLDELRKQLEELRRAQADSDKRARDAEKELDEAVPAVARKRGRPAKAEAAA